MDVLDKRWEAIAENYNDERDQNSLPSLLIDDLIVGYFQHHKDTVKTIIDYGAGTGRLSQMLADQGYQVSSFEPSPPMNKKLKDRQLQSCFTVIDHVEGLALFDAALCINVVDHVDQLDLFLQQLNDILKPGGKMILSIPHPVKDLGNWRKEIIEGKLCYIDYRIDGYFNEGICYKNRENRKGQVIAEGIPSHHRTISTYYNAVIAARFSVDQIHEPTVTSLEGSINHEKASRLPYFLILECTKV